MTDQGCFSPHSTSFDMTVERENFGVLTFEI